MKNVFLMSVFASALSLVTFQAHADQVLLDDQILQGSQCVGQDCANGETFGFDTVRLKENNVRIQFLDTSASASFPSVDWTLVANDTSNGGRNRFSIEDTTAQKEIFTLMGGAPDYSVFVGESGFVGLGSNNPQQALHVTAQNAPTIRLEQSAAGGWPAASWDLCANEQAFCIKLNGEEKFRLNADGTLTVAGAITTVTPAGTFPDFVFEPSYQLMPLNALASFIADKGHLPNIPSAKEVGEQGVNMSELQIKLLQKVEELTLYTLKQQEQLEKQQQTIDALQQQLNDSE